MVMYNELYNAWQYEIDKKEIGHLPIDFYSRLSEYITFLRDENTQDTKKTVNSVLLAHELAHVTCMIQELMFTRYNKLIENINENKKLPLDVLSIEEKKIYSIFLSFTKEYHLFKKNLSSGAILKTNNKKPQKRILLRVLKDIPAFIGLDMTSYGPFLQEDLASLPLENAELLEKQGLGKLVRLLI